MSARKKGIGRDVRHDDAADVHDKEVKRYARDGRGWAASGDPERSALDQRDANISFDAAEVDRDRGRLERARDDE